MPEAVCQGCRRKIQRCSCITPEHCEQLVAALEDLKKFDNQSGTTSDANIRTVPRRADYENVTFSEQQDPYIYDVESYMDPTRSLQDSDDATLNNFFSRPIKIHEEEWGTGTSLGFDIDPWSLYLDNPRVSNRLANYNLLKCNLKVKVVINGNGFQYGRAICAYLPFDELDFLSTNAALVSADLVGTSQLPHIFLDPTTSMGGEMKLPMFWIGNYLSIPLADWDQLGRLYFRSINDLKHANGASDVVTISVFAWAEDVNMSVLTSTEPATLSPQAGEEIIGFEPQSGEIEQANKEGIVSGPATAVSKWASFLTKVPYIGPFAKATEIGGGAVASIAKMFGYCRPPVTRNPEPYRPTPMSSLALTNVPDTAQKMTVDDKQELTIDPRIAGLGGIDPLNIREIAKRESYLTKFTWAIGTTPETLLWNARVDPVQWAESGSTAFHFPACAFAALPFQYWTGTMKFRFQIVASTFHKGRIKVVYDPQYLASNEYNTNYLRIIDIAEEQDFTIDIGVGQDYTLLEHHYPGIEPVSDMYSTTAFTSKQAGNGVIGVYIVNELTTPNSTANNDIEVNVYVSMGDDFEVFVPEDHFQKFVFAPQSGEEILGFEPQSGMEEPITPDSQNTTEPSAPQQEMSETVGMGDTQDPLINHVFTGEAVSSFRALLKRYNLFTCLPCLDNADTVRFGRMPNFPYLRGNVTNAVDQAAGPVPYNFCNTVLLHWVRNAFSGWRGSIRYKLIPRGRSARSDLIDVQRAPYKAGAPIYSATTTTVPVYATYSQARQGLVMATDVAGEPSSNVPFAGHNGQVITIGSINNALEFETPYYSFQRFEGGKPQSYTGGMVNQGQAWDYRIEFHSDSSAILDLHVAAGEDFQVYFFTGLPRMYYEANPPAAA